MITECHRTAFDRHLVVSDRHLVVSDRHSWSPIVTLRRPNVAGVSTYDDICVSLRVPCAGGFLLAGPARASATLFKRLQGHTF